MYGLMYSLMCGLMCGLIYGLMYGLMYNQRLVLIQKEEKREVGERVIYKNQITLQG